jgi:hypothetical protein
MTRCAKLVSVTPAHAPLPAPPKVRSGRDSSKSRARAHVLPFAAATPALCLVQTLAARQSLIVEAGRFPSAASDGRAGCGAGRDGANCVLTLRNAFRLRVRVVCARANAARNPGASWLERAGCLVRFTVAKGDSTRALVVVVGGTTRLPRRAHEQKQHAPNVRTGHDATRPLVL